MKNLELNPSEQELLIEILEQDLKRLKNEIIRTDHQEFRSALLEREKTLEGIIVALTEAARTELVSSPS